MTYLQVAEFLLQFISQPLVVSLQLGFEDGEGIRAAVGQELQQ